jgi:hypothetical protein
VLYLYLDESGDMGFDFFAKKPSRCFTICVLKIQGWDDRRRVAKALQRTLQRKTARGVHELKGAKTSIETKDFFYQRAADTPFEIYALTLNKKRVYERLTQQKERLYNYIARLVLDKIPYDSASARVELVIDKSKNKKEIEEFNGYLVQQLRGKVDPLIPLNISHHSSQADLLLQAADLFSWGIFRKYERRDTEWFDIFKSKVKFDDIYLA